jgi:hypothetical protein
VRSKRSADVLLTGIPRSGTTLVCELLNRLPDTVALDEPMDAPELTGARHAHGDQPPDPTLICDDIAKYLEKTRESIAQRRTAISKHVAGRVSGEKLGSERRGELRVERESKGEIRVAKELSGDFLLVIKHPGAFTALLEPLVERFRLYAIVRNPLAILSSWQTVPFTMRDGRHPIPERLDRDLAASLDEAGDPVDRQLRLLGWYFNKYRALPKGNIIHYESIVESGGKVLDDITDRASKLDERLEGRNRMAVHALDPVSVRRLTERLLNTAGPYWDFYTKQSVEELADR